MRPFSQLKTLFGKTIESQGEDGFRAFYSTQGITYTVIVSFGLGWEHASISVLKPKQRVPTWPEMCMFKELIWGDDECVMQLHPPKKDYVNTCKHCLHLWRPQKKKIPLPSKIFV